MPGEATVASSEAWLDLGSGWLFEHIRDAVLVADAESATLLLWNPAAEQLFGYGRDEVVGRGVTQILPDLDDQGTWLELLGAAASTGERSHATELVGLRRSGSSVVIEATPSLIHAPSDGRQYLLLVVREASERRLQAALATQRFLDSATSALASSLEYDTTLQSMARLAVPRLGDVCIVYAIDNELTVDHVAAAHCDPQVEAQLTQAVDGSQARVCIEATQITRPRVVSTDDGLWSHLANTGAERAMLTSLGIRSVMLVPLVGPAHVLGLMLVGSSQADRYQSADQALAEDLARRYTLALDNARLYRTAQQAIAARDQFLSIASHELRAPLTRLKIHAEVLQLAHSNGHLDPERLEWSIQRINAAVDRLATLTKDVLDLSRLRGGQFPFRPSPVDLVELISDLEVRFAEQLGERHELVIDLDIAECPVLVDQDRIEQILSNLLDNAAKYSPGGSRVRLSVERTDDGVLMAVHDRGLGLPEGADAVIFEAFGRAANAEHVPGMGLGLHICRIIVERHGGRIWADSRGENQGTTINVWLPFAEASPLPTGDVQQRLTNQLTLALGYCELLANNPELPAALREQALGAIEGARGAAATLEDLQTLSR